MSGQLSNLIILSRLDKLNALVPGKDPGQVINCAGQPDRLPASRPPRRVCRQLGKSQVAELIAAYQNGATTNKLSNDFHVDPTTVRAILKRSGIALRGRRA